VSSDASIPTLTRLRRRLTAWYAATFGIILLLLGTGLYTSIHSQFTRQLKDSLRDATKELIGHVTILPSTGHCIFLKGPMWIEPNRRDDSLDVNR